jgi:hypothetical protein
MGIGRPCSVCSLAFDIRKEADRRLMAGDTAASVHRWLSATHKIVIPLRTLHNHNSRHVRMIARAAAKLSDAQRERKDQVETARAVVERQDWDAMAYLQPSAISKDIFRTSQRLDAAAETAFIDREHASLAQLSAQLLRSSELRGRLGGTISDASQVALQVNIGQLTSKVVEAMESDPEKRRSVALTLMGGPAPASALDPVLDLGVIPDPALRLSRLPGSSGGAHFAPGPVRRVCNPSQIACGAPGRPQAPGQGPDTRQAQNAAHGRRRGSGYRRVPGSRRPPGSAVRGDR